MLYLQLHSSLSNMRSICQAYAKHMPSLLCHAFQELVLSKRQLSSTLYLRCVQQHLASSSLKYYKLLQSLPIYYLCFDETTLNNKNCRFPNRDDAWASWNWAGQGCSGLVKLSQIQTGEVSCRNPAAWLNGGKDFWNDLAYMMYMQYPFVFGCLRNVRSTFGMGITWQDNWHVSAILNQAKWQTGMLSQCSVNAQWSLLATGIHWM